MVEFTFNGIKYRTNADASVVEGLDGKTWNRTHSLSVRAAALAALKSAAEKFLEEVLDELAKYDAGKPVEDWDVVKQLRQERLYLEEVISEFNQSESA
jgi:hypothetical protein